MDFFTKIKRATSGLFCIASICFFLPFLTISCGNDKIVSLNGLDLLIGIDKSVVENIDKNTAYDVTDILMDKKNQAKPTDLEFKDDSQPVEPELEPKRTPANGYGITLLIICVLGVVTYLLKDLATINYLAIFLSLIGLVCLYLIPHQITYKAISGMGSGLLVGQKEIGFWADFLCLSTVFFVNVYSLFRDQFDDSVIETQL